MKNHREVTIYDIARKLNLSASTVSRGLRDHPAIRESTICKIKEVAEAMGYQQNTFASNLRNNRSNTIGVILPRVDSSFQAAVVSGMEGVAAKNGYNLLIGQSRESVRRERASIKTLFDSRPDGLLLSLAADTQDLDHLEMFLKKGIPVVLFDRIREHPEFRCTTVVIDNRKAGYEMTSHLLEQGCRRILFISDNRISNVYHERFYGYKEALRENGVPFDPEMAIEDILNEASGKRTVDLIRTMKPMPDAIFAANDVSAAAILSELKNAGIRVPGDMAVAGFNNVQISRVVEPGLTTVHYPGVEMGEVAATTLIEMIQKKPPPVHRHIVLEHQLIIRDSTLRKQR